MNNIKGIIEGKNEFFSCCDKKLYPERHILLCFDDNYAFPAGVNIFSIIQNNPNSALHFHLFMQNVSDVNKNKLEKLTSDFVSMTEYFINNEFKIHSNNTKSFPVSACLRLVAPLLLPKEVNKLLYVDSDTLCLASLDELYNIEFGDKIIAAVADVEHTQISQCKKLGLRDGSYFNSGVMLYNNEKWNQLDITEKALTLLNEGTKYKFPDQDVLNILLQDKIYYLSDKYNCITLLTVEGYEDNAIADDTVFIHYVSGSKPWFKLYLTPTYNQYIKKSPWYDSKLLLANVNSPSTTRRYSKLLAQKRKYGQAFLYYVLYLKHKLNKNNG